MTEIEVPVKKIVKDYFLNINNLGPDGFVTKKSELGRIIYCILGFDPLDEDESVVYVNKPQDNFYKMEVVVLQVTFPIKADLLQPNHLMAIGEAMFALFEREFMCFCAGRFTKSVNFLAATKVFLKMHELLETEADFDNFRRVMERKYRERIESLITRYRVSQQMEIKEKYKAMGIE